MWFCLKIDVVMLKVWRVYVNGLTWLWLKCWCGFQRINVVVLHWGITKSNHSPSWSLVRLASLKWSLTIMIMIVLWWITHKLAYEAASQRLQRRTATQTNPTETPKGNKWMSLRNMVAANTLRLPQFFDLSNCWGQKQNKNSNDALYVFKVITFYSF